MGGFTIYSVRSLVAVNRQLDEISLSLEATDRIQLALFKAEATERAFLLHRPDAFDRDDPRGGEADLILAKHRNGPTKTVTVAHQLHLSRFANMAR